MLYLEKEKQLSMNARLEKFISHFSSTSLMKGMVFNSMGWYKHKEQQCLKAWRNQ